jgi:uncharacterized repeat protein (TIGR02543 family)
MNPVREGYEFAGWYEDEALTTRFPMDARVFDDKKLFAKWVKNPITVSFHDSMTPAAEMPDSQLIKPGQAIVDPATISPPDES